MKPRLRALPFAFFLFAGTAAAEQRHMTATGTSFGVASPCARQVTIDPDPTLSGQVTIDATADNPQELAQLAFSGSGDAAKLRGPTDRCWRPDENIRFEPTLTIHVRVPPNFAVAIDESGSGDYRLGTIGALAVDFSGSGRLQAAAITTLSVDMSGSGQLSAARVDGAVHAEISGSGAIDIAGGTLPALDLDISGSGGFRLGAGSIGKMNVDTSGSGKVQIGGTVGDAKLQLSGSGSVDIAKLTGSMSQEVEGSGTVRIGSR
ncbi:MAG: DUF2807 domain-containing protein [Rhodospirillales bacterium]